MADSPTDAQEPECRLLELPGELRNRIYRLAVLEDEPIQILWVGMETKKNINLKKPPGPPSLAFTCKTIRHEMLAIWLGENTFSVTNPRAANIGQTAPATFTSREILKWKKSLGDMSRLLRSVSLSFSELLLYRTNPNVNRDWYVATSLHHGGELRVAVEVRNIIDGVFTTTHCCKCDLQRMANESKRRGMDSGRLLDILRAFCDNYTYQLVGVDCKKCQLPMLV